MDDILVFAIICGVLIGVFFLTTLYYACQAIYKTHPSR